MGAVGLIAEALTRLSKLTSAEFSPKKDCGVFFTAPVLAERFSAMLSRSKGSPDVIVASIQNYTTNFNEELLKKFTRFNYLNTIINRLWTCSEFSPVSDHIEFI